ncbi:MFS family transporter [Ochrobactrum sp. RH2CCR150]|uniref:MFS family transporter n=1 Tax=Ochrobactrum sp. RH2CCR150 TaxID=2587044 RepID=UPI0015FA7FB9|nr:MHS family alpha-ketoglutarate permease-like MFS transporter [Ochrobactrum sp. RH2CCR150]URQ75547.1 MAG: MFS family transporter [Candidatus Ochrobactrum gambitense]WEK15665.1 MAG: MFS family transporter [Candidatus Ochrobactrum gambitense]
MSNAGTHEDANGEIEAVHDAHDTRRRVYAIVASASGNLVEWYDFYVYSFGALYFASQFFPAEDQTSQLLNAAAIFAAGFLMRPIGGWLFGRIADKLGRRTSMLISVTMMCFGSFAIAILPTYASIGVLAPVLLLIVRLLQGLSVGGEYGTTATYMSEVALAGRRGFFSSFQYVTLIGGQLLAVLVIVVLQFLLTSEQLHAWGWRIPFAIGGLAAIVALFLRRTLHETTTEETRNSKAAGSFATIWKHHRKAFLVVVGFTAGGSLAFYTFTTYMQKYLVNTAGMSKETASETMTFVLLAYMLMQPLFGALSDKIGRKTMMIGFGGISILTTIPLMTLIGSVQSSTMAFIYIVIALAVVSMYTSISGIVKAELFPAEVRALGVGFSYAIANAIFGGTAEYVALWFKQQGMESGFFWYVTIMMVIVFAVSIFMPNPRKHGYLQGHGSVD